LPLRFVPVALDVHDIMLNNIYGIIESIDVGANLVFAQMFDFMFLLRRLI